jgi:hypothetical protein
VNPRTVRAYIERGDLVAKAEGEGIQKTYLVSIDSLYALRDRRGYPRHSRAQTRDRPASPEASAAVSGGDLTDIIRDLTSELVQRSQESAELRTRLELTAEAESTLREQLEREREETRRLREELEAKCSKGFWRSCSGVDQQLHLYAGCG